MVKAVRQNKPNTKKDTIWPKKDQMRYYLFIVNFAIDQPYCFLSWQNWKPCNYFVKMAEFIGTKTAKQVKSFDQRKKIEYRQSDMRLTMLEWIVKHLTQNYIEEYPIVSEKLKELKEVLNEGETTLTNQIRQSRKNIGEIMKDLTEEQKGIFIE